MQSRDKIKKFTTLVDKIKSSRFVLNTENIRLNFNLQEDQSCTQKIFGVDEEDMRSMLIDLRKLTLVKDDVYLLDIFDALESEASTDITKNKISEWKNAYVEFLAGPPSVPLKVNGTIESISEILEKWFYGHYFHEHENHKKHLNDMYFGQSFYKYNFLMAVSALVKIAEAVARIADEVTAENDSDDSKISS